MGIGRKATDQHTPCRKFLATQLVGLELTDGWEQVEMLWCRGAQNIGLYPTTVKTRTIRCLKHRVVL